MEWVIQKASPIEQMMKERNIGPILTKVLMINGDYQLSQHFPLNDFSLFKDSDKVIKRIQKAIKNEEKIVIYGDYDCDGIMATSILVRAFELLKVNVGYHIPDRFKDGYGLNEKRVIEMHEKGYSLIITVDNGISSHQAILKANELGMDVIVTDHHDLPESLPEAYAIIHTQVSNDYPFKPICGGFVACKLASALLGYNDPYIYCMAALATVSDMMPMKNENRTLVKRALEVMSQQKYMSFELLLGENGNYNITTLGFQLAPKINAVGRLVDGLNPNKCVTYFRHDDSYSDKERAFKLQFATMCQQLNTQRQKMTTTQYELAKKNMQDLSGAIVSASEEFHEGLVGLVAGRITNEFYQPSFIVSYDKESEIYKGSARSIAGLDLHQLLEFLKDDTIVFGGHERAGGFSISKEKWPLFLNHLDEYMALHINEDILIEKKYAIEIESHDLSIGNVKELEMLQPFGMDNEEPTFYLKLARPSSIETLSNGKHLKMIFDLEKTKLQVLYFNKGELYHSLLEKNEYELYGQLSINKFRNFEIIQLILKDIR